MDTGGGMGPFCVNAEKKDYLQNQENKHRVTNLGRCRNLWNCGQYRTPMVEYRFVRALVIVYDQYGVLHQSLGSVGASYESARVNVNKSLRLCSAVDIRDTIVLFFAPKRRHNWRPFITLRDRNVSVIVILAGSTFVRFITELIW